MTGRWRLPSPAQNAVRWLALTDGRIIRPYSLQGNKIIGPYSLWGNKIIGPYSLQGNKIIGPSPVVIVQVVMATDGCCQLIAHVNNLVPMATYRWDMSGLPLLLYL